MLNPEEYEGSDTVVVLMIRNREQLLFVRSPDNNYWCLPMYNCLPNEDPCDTALHLANEVLGLQFDYSDLDSYNSVRDTVQHFTLDIFGNFNVSDEVLELLSGMNSRNHIEVKSISLDQVGHAESGVRGYDRMLICDDLLMADNHCTPGAVKSVTQTGPKVETGPNPEIEIDYVYLPHFLRPQVLGPKPD